MAKEPQGKKPLFFKPDINLERDIHHLGQSFKTQRIFPPFESGLGKSKSSTIYHKYLFINSCGLIKPYFVVRVIPISNTN